MTAERWVGDLSGLELHLLGGDCELRVRERVGDVLRVTAAGRQERSGVPRPMHSAAALPQFRYL
jgi:hypothetical protein